MTDAQEHELRENTKITAKVCALLTGNGNPSSGLLSKVEYIVNNMVTKDACEKIRSEPGKRHRSNWLVIKDVILVVLAMFTLLLGSGLLKGMIK